MDRPPPGPSPRPANPIAGFARGFLLPLRAAPLLLARRGLKRYALLPLIANILVYGLVLALAIWFLANLELSVGAWDFWGPVGRWLAYAINLALGPLKWLVALPAFLVACYFSFTTVGLIIAAPFNDLLSARVERALCRPDDDEPSVPLLTTAKMMLGGIVDAAIFAGRQLLVILLMLPLLFIPLVGVIPLLLVTGYFTGIGYYDVAMARHDLRRQHKKPAIQARRWELLGFGLAMELLFILPVTGLLMLPVGTTAGTIVYCRTDWDDLLARTGLKPPPGFTAPRVA